MFDRILELLDSKWLIHRDTAVSYLPLLVAYLNGQPVAFNPNEKKGKFSKPNVLVKTVTGFSAMYPEDGDSSPVDFSNPDLPEHSVALIPIQGPIFSWNSLQLIEAVKQAQINDKIIAALFVVNSPGGQVFMTDIAAQAIKGFNKPTVGMIMNMAASAAMWMISGMTYRIATSPMDLIGSIGVYTSFMDMQVLLKDKLGITITDIYATLSTRKNEMVRALKEGNLEPITKDLDFVNDIFHQAIRENLSIEKESEVFTGAIYNAIEAQKHGLITEIGTMDYAYQKAYEEGLIHRMTQFHNSNQKQ
ncbi:MAG: S49 family peptidase [Bacteroidales bacterium]